MSDFKLPSRLRRHFTNLSVTIQQLVTEIVLTIEGMPSQENRAEDAKLEQAARARRSNEFINERLREFINTHQMNADDAAIASCTANGRTTTEIADFLGLEQNYVMRRVNAIRKTVAAWNPETGKVEAYSDGNSIIEIFAEARQLGRNVKKRNTLREIR